MMRMIYQFVAVLLFSLPLGQIVAAENDSPRVALETSMGTIVVELNREKAPKSVENFLRYVSDGFYEGTLFHRVIADFMIQGGGFDAEYVRKPTRAAVDNEADNGLRNARGTIAMARTYEPHSATAQFFINHRDNAFLNHKGKSLRAWGYTVFGKVVDGMNVVDEIADVRTGAGGPFKKDVPQTRVVIKKATLLP